MLVPLAVLDRYDSHHKGFRALLINLKPLSLLLKASPLIDELALYDVVNTPGVAADLSHISSPSVSAPTRLHHDATALTLRTGC